jgi:hypothetical protein
MFRGGEAKSSALLGGQARHSALSIACCSLFSCVVGVKKSLATLTAAGRRE